MLKKVMVYSVFLCLALFFSMSSAVRAAGNEDISLSAGNTNPALNEQFQVTITGHDLTDLYAYELGVTYDTEHLEFIQAVNASGGFNVAPIVSGGSIQLPHTEIGDTAGLSGNQTLSTLTFKAIHTGQAQIALTDLLLMDAHSAAKQVSSDSRLTLNIQAAAVTVPSGGGTYASAGDSGTTYDAAMKRVTSILDLASFTKAQEQLQPDAAGSKILDLEVKPHADAEHYVQVLPSQALNGETAHLSLRVKTPLATLYLPGDMFKGRALPADSIGLHVALADAASAGANVQLEVGHHPILALSFQAEDADVAWDNVNSPVIVGMPYTPSSLELQNPEHIVVRYIDTAGAIHAVPSGKYNPATGEVIFTITHFSLYAIAYSQRTFDDLGAVDRAKHQIEVMASKGVVNGVTDKEFQPANAITRADFLVLLLRTLELQGKEGAPFADVSEKAYYSDSLRMARELGIAAGYEGNIFKPLDPITREDMMVLTVRALKAAHREVQPVNAAASMPFADASDIASYAKESVNLLVNADVIHGYDQKIHPQATTTRAETVVLMYNLYNH